jgi:hypothetical protein
VQPSIHLSIHRDPSTPPLILKAVQPATESFLASCFRFLVFEASELW